MTTRRRVFFHIMSSLILLGSLLYGFLYVRLGLLRLIETGRDFGLSIATWFSHVVGIDFGVVPTVGLPSKIDFSSVVDLDTEKLQRFFVLFVDPTYIQEYFSTIGNGLLIFLPFSWILLCLVFMGIYLLKRLYLTPNNDYGKDTVFLRAFKKISRVLYDPAKRFVLSYVSFLSEYKIYIGLFVFVWLLSTNIVSIAIEALAFLFVFSATFDLSPIGVVFTKLIVDSAIFFKYCPFVLWVSGMLFFISVARRKKGIQRLENIEAKNEEVLEDLPVVTLFVGKMGTGKDLTMTALSLSESVRYRNLARERLVANDLKFPFFPWILFETDLRKAIEDHKVFNKYTAGLFADRIVADFEADPKPENLYGYDPERYAMEYDDGLRVQSLFEVLKIYAQLYYIYTFSTSMIVSNHAIREDFIVEDLGNFPSFTVDFFGSSARESAARSRFSHILDFDMLRLGKTMMEDNIFRRAVDFGIFDFSESGKDRGNQYDHMRIEKGSITIKQIRKIFKKYEKYEFIAHDEIFDELAKLEEEKCSSLNDYFNLMIKMFRHMATVDGVCFATMFMNDQREQCLNADARELCDVITLKEKSKIRNVLPFNVYDEILRDLIYEPFRRLYDQIRVVRGDNTLVVHLLKILVASLEKHYVRIRNTFDYFSVSFTKENGTMDTAKADKEEGKIYLCKKQVYSDRYSTDCFGGYFDRRSALSTVGLGDVPTFGSSKATWDELKSTNGFFINILEKTFEESDDD